MVSTENEYLMVIIDFVFFCSAPSTANRSAKMAMSEDKSAINGEELLKPTQEKTQFDRPVPGSTLRCLEDPGINSPPGVRGNPATKEVVDKARDRFDRFWGGSAGDDQK